MTEPEAVTIVQNHAEYRPDNPLRKYFLRYPPTSGKALFADDTRELVELLLRRENHGSWNEVGNV